MSMRAPHRWAVAAVDLATALMPPGPVRRRYRQEFIAEMWGMSSGRQISYALSTLASARKLHAALVASGELDFPHSPLWCRVRLHHRYGAARTPDGYWYRRCRECGLDEGVRYAPTSVDVYALGQASRTY